MMIAYYRASLLGNPLNADEYGGKAAQLSAALRRGLPVPDGFAVPATTLDRLADGTLEDDEQTALLDLARRFDRIPVAVRSSAVGEDGAGASFAGQHVSILNVRGADEILSAMASVWRSGHSPAARAYRARLGVYGAPRVGVVVQRLTPAQVSGVLFTADPLSGGRSRWLVEATWGLGEAVVSGLVTPDRFVIKSSGELLERSAGHKDVMVVPISDGGTAEADQTDPAAVTTYCLTEYDLWRLADLGAACESLFGPAQDIEWALASGTLYLLQSRPITTGAAGA